MAKLLAELKNLDLKAFQIQNTKMKSQIRRVDSASSESDEDTDEVSERSIEGGKLQVSSSLTLSSQLTKQEKEKMLHDITEGIIMESRMLKVEVLKIQLQK